MALTENKENNPGDNYSDNDSFTNDESDENIFDNLIDTTRKALSLIEEQKLIGNIKWCKAVKKSFDPIAKLVGDIEKHQRKRTMEGPHNQYSLFSIIFIFVVHLNIEHKSALNYLFSAVIYISLHFK